MNEFFEKISSRIVEEDGTVLLKTTNYEIMQKKCYKHKAWEITQNLFIFPSQMVYVWKKKNYISFISWWHFTTPAKNTMTSLSTNVEI